MNVLDEILKEHKKFREMIAQIENASKDKKETFRKLYAEVKGHHEAEEHELFKDVKSMLQKQDDEEIVLEMYEEHSLGAYQLSVIEKTSVDNETWDAKFSVLKEVLEHHMEEEEKDFIPLAREVLTPEQLEEKVEAFERTKKKYEDEMMKKLKSN